MPEKGSRHRPWFPFFAGDFMNSTRRWTCEEIGAYILLLGEQWINEDVPTDVDELARIHPDIAKHWETKLKRKFPAGRNPRMEELREEMQERSAKNRDAALRRWGRDPENSESNFDDANAHALAHANEDANADANADANGYAKGYAKTMRKPMLSTPTSTSIQTTKSKPKNKRSEVSDTMWKKFCDAYPKRLGADPNKSARAKAERCIKTGAQWSEIMTGVRKYRDSCEAQNTEPQFIMRKESFLNPQKEFWLAEYPVPDKPQGVGVASNWNSRSGDAQPVDEEAELLSLAPMLGMHQGQEETKAQYLIRIRQANDRRLQKLAAD